MNDFERDLRDALSRREPPPGFTERVMSKIPQKRRAWWHFPVFRWVPAVAMLLVIVSVAGILQERVEQQQRRERARQELMMAMEVTARSIHTTKVKLLTTGGRI